MAESIIRQQVGKPNSVVFNSTEWGWRIKTISLQKNPPTGQPARLFVEASDGTWYHIDLPYKV